jgi:hypothetical protein
LQRLQLKSTNVKWAVPDNKNNNSNDSNGNNGNNNHQQQSQTIQNDQSVTVNSQNDNMTPPAIINSVSLSHMTLKRGSARIPTKHV